MPYQLVKFTCKRLQVFATCKQWNEMPQEWPAHSPSPRDEGAVVIYVYIMEFLKFSSSIRKEM
jgi:hypothetical protein